MSEDWHTRLVGLGVEPVRDEHLTLYAAIRFDARRKGLAKLDALPHGVGLHIHRCSAVHTFGMRFAIDLIWRDRDGRVIRVDRDVPRRRQRLCVRAKSVVEVAAGDADQWVGVLPRRRTP